MVVMCRFLRLNSVLVSRLLFQALIWRRMVRHLDLVLTVNRSPLGRGMRRRSRSLLLFRLPRPHLPMLAQRSPLRLLSRPLNLLPFRPHLLLRLRVLPACCRLPMP